MKLLLAPLKVIYQELFSLIVCNINNRECMEHRCPKCFESNTLLQVFFHTIGEIDDDVIEISQQTTTDRSNVTHQTETVDVCIGATTYLAVLHLEMSIEALDKVKI